MIVTENSHHRVDIVGQEIGVDGGVRIEDCQQKIGRALAGKFREIWPDGVAVAEIVVAGRTVLVEMRRAAFGVASQ